MQENRQGEAPSSYIASRLVYAVRGEGAAFDREAKLFVQGRPVPVTRRSLCLYLRLPVRKFLLTFRNTEQRKAGIGG